MQDKYLQRSHVSYSGRFVLTFYLIAATIILSVVGGIHFVGEPTEEIVNGLPFATDIPGLGRSAKVETSQWEERPGQGFIGWVRLIPVPDQSEPGIKLPSKVYSLGREDQHGSALPTFYYRIFTESDLMRRLSPPCAEIIFVTYY